MNTKARRNSEPDGTGGFASLLAAQSLKMTRPRKVIIGVLAAARVHLSHDEIWRRAKAIDPTIGQTTVYRTLNALTRLGIAASIDLADGRGHFCLCRTGDHHHHVVCTECGKTGEFDECALPPILAAIEKKTRFTIRDHRLTLFGVCGDCRRKT
jgi:Fur family ferric uptake transcriptional regulator